MPAKKKPTEQQLENLRKGFEALKAKRKKAEETEESPPVPPPTPTPVIDPTPVPPTPAAPAPEVKVKKERKKREQFDPKAFRESLVAELRMPLIPQPTPLVTERVVEPIEKVVYKERLLTGSEILNKLFNF